MHYVLYNIIFMSFFFFFCLFHSGLVGLDRAVILPGIKDTNRKIRTTFSIEYCCWILVPNTKPGAHSAFVVSLTSFHLCLCCWNQVWNRSNFHRCVWSLISDHSSSYLSISIFTGCIVNFNYEYNFLKVSGLQSNVVFQIWLSNKILSSYKPSRAKFIFEILTFLDEFLASFCLVCSSPAACEFRNSRASCFLTS